MFSSQSIGIAIAILSVSIATNSVWHHAV